MPDKNSSDQGGFLVEPESKFLRHRADWVKGELEMARIQTITFLWVFCLAACSPVVLSAPGMSTPSAEPSTPHPANTPNPAATRPYEIPSPPKNMEFYPTTGLLATAVPTPNTSGMYFFQPPIAYGGCWLKVINQYVNLDGVVMLADGDTSMVVTAIYVLAGDSYSAGGIGAGTYYTYIALGRGWDNVRHLFTTRASYFRSRTAVNFGPCKIGIEGHEELTITLNYTGGTGSDMISLQPGAFPGAAP